MLKPKINRTIDTAAYDHTSYNTYGIVTWGGTDLPWVGNPNDHQVTIPNTLSGISTIADAKGKSFVVAKESKSYEMRNTSNDKVDLEIMEFTPKNCVGEELFTDLSVTVWDWANLVGALMDKDDPTGTYSGGLTKLSSTPLRSANVKRVFKVKNLGKICMESGQTMKIGLHAKRYTKIDGDMLQTDGEFQFYPGVFKFLLIRAIGGIVHDTTNAALVGMGSVHLNIIYRRTIIYYQVPTDKREYVVTENLDTIAQAEAPTADVQMEDQKEE